MIPEKNTGEDSDLGHLKIIRTVEYLRPKYPKITLYLPYHSHAKISRMGKILTIRATELYDGRTILKNKTITISGNRILDVSSSKAKPDFEGVITPAFIDAHSHIGMFRAGEPGSESEGNEELNQILPTSDPLLSVYYDDPTFGEAVDAGVLYSCIIPGSGNLFGGRARIIRHFVNNIDQALVKDYGYKMALGFNPRSTGHWKGERPNTRMGIYGLIEKRFDAVIRKEAQANLTFEQRLFDLEKELAEKTLSQSSYSTKKSFLERERDLALDNEEKTLLDALSGKRPIKVHVHKEDDVMYLLELKKRYGLQVTAEHTMDVHTKRVFSLLAKNDIPVVYGPVGSGWSKVELKNEHSHNVKHLIESGAMYGLMTDHPVIHVTCLRDTLRFFLRWGVTPADAIAIVTRRNAEIL